MKKLAYLMLLIVFSNMLLVSATDSNTLNYSKKLKNSLFMDILISMYGWVLIGLVVKFIIKRLK